MCAAGGEAVLQEVFSRVSQFRQDAIATLTVSVATWDLNSKSCPSSCGHQRSHEMSVDTLLREVQRWQAALRFPSNEQEQKIRDVCVKYVSTDSQGASMTFSIGRSPTYEFVLRCIPTIEIHSDATRLRDWCKRVNALIAQRLLEGGRLTGAVVLQEAALAFLDLPEESADEPPSEASLSTTAGGAEDSDPDTDPILGDFVVLPPAAFTIPPVPKSTSPTTAAAIITTVSATSTPSATTTATTAATTATTATKPAPSRATVKPQPRTLHPVKPPPPAKADQKDVIVAAQSRSDRVAELAIAQYALLNTAELRSEFGIHVMQSKDNRLCWLVTMFNFPEGSELHNDLEEYRKRFGVSDILFELYFTREFPLEPPVMRCVRPRLISGTGNITIGGSCGNTALRRRNWDPQTALREILLGVKSDLLSCNARLEMRVRHTYPRYCDLRARLTERYGTKEAVLTLRCYEPMYVERGDLENGNIILLPESARAALDAKGISWPYYFRIASANSSVYSVCAVPKFEAPEGLVIAPIWLMQNLGIDNGTKAVVCSTHAPLGRAVQLQPQTHDFARDMDQIRDTDPLLVISDALQTFFTLTTGDIIPIEVRGKTYWFEVKKTAPGKTICIHPTDDQLLDLKMDLLPAVEHLSSGARSGLTPLSLLPKLQRPMPAGGISDITEELGDLSIDTAGAVEDDAAGLADATIVTSSRLQRLSTDVRTLPPCRYNAQCRSLGNELHRTRYSHPCRFGTSCFSIAAPNAENALHRAQFLHVDDGDGAAAAAALPSGAAGVDLPAELPPNPPCRHGTECHNMSDDWHRSEYSHPCRSGAECWSLRQQSSSAAEHRVQFTHGTTQRRSVPRLSSRTGVVAATVSAPVQTTITTGGVVKPPLTKPSSIAKPAVVVGVPKPRPAMRLPSVPAVVLPTAQFPGPAATVVDPTAAPTFNADDMYELERCWYGEACPDLGSSAHCARFSHPCVYGEGCWQFTGAQPSDPKHIREQWHIWHQ